MTGTRWSVKKRFSPTSSNDLMWRPRGKSGAPNNIVSTPNASSSSTKPGPRPTWCAATAAAQRDIVSQGAPLWATGAQRLSSRACAMTGSSPPGDGLPDERPHLSNVSQGMPRAGAQTSRYGHHDNLGSHKSQAVRDSITEQGAHLLFLPPYSPDFNPIENFFSKLKALLKVAKERTLDDLWSRIGVILEQTSPQECKNFIRHDGYA